MMLEDLEGSELPPCLPTPLLYVSKLLKDEKEEYKRFVLQYKWNRAE
jgi:hypothetical protein